MTDLNPEDSNEADLVEQNTDIEDDLDLDADLDDPADLEFEDDAWDTDLADLADQKTDAPLNDDE